MYIKYSQIKSGINFKIPLPVQTALSVHMKYSDWNGGHAEYNGKWTPLGHILEVELIIIAIRGEEIRGIKLSRKYK